VKGGGSRRAGFEWDALKAHNNLLKHGVSFDEAVTVFEDPLSISAPDPLHSDDEARYVEIGLSDTDRLLVVAYAMRGYRIRLISSRPATSRERKRYEKE
jgi:uncharacterized DUF497 family protein